LALDRNGIREGGQGGLAGQVVALGGAAGEELEDGVGARGVVAVLVRVGGQQAVHARPDHLQEGMLGEAGVAGIVQRRGKGPGQDDALVELPDGEQPGVAGKPARRWLDDV
jgi:hypothetical protein